ncbi:phosphodiester glycosidase family protein [Oerskovia paurometabola]|uniref:Phosphodiester glycosidase family protein n=1 Tax=Oerskovia paurometabola TaxID=162170 RepID=A0ABW1XB48_9CELL|nr:phosphodiester glycosidase family protein [Oerskovia paurometabola]MBM7497182.1 exopolysaccharide biosynthesis protein [Oerskovia paurometabola]
MTTDDQHPGTPSTAPPARRRRRRRRRAFVAGGLALTLTLGGATAWALDRYVVEHVEIADVAAYEASQATDSGTQGAPSGTSAGSSSETGATADASTSSDGTSVSVRQVVEGSGDDTVTYYVADVVLGEATDLRSAFAQNAFGENITEKTSDIAAGNDALLAINGDYYGFRSTGIVIRNGVVYRDEGAREGLAFYRDGTVEVYDETTTTAQELVDAGVWNTLSFGPALLDGGDVLDGIADVEVDTNVGNHSIQGEQPRTAVGVIGENHLVFVVVDGRSTGYSRGVTMTGLAEIMQDLGATTAYNLDGGGSSTMYYDGELVNDPLGRGAERGTSDILYVGE